MTTAVKLFKSTDVGAPTLTGQAGSLVALLSACLVDGYNLNTITITRSGATATATDATGHGYAEDDVVLHAGANQAEYNGEFKIFNVTSTTYDFTVTGTPATPATGTITAKRAPAGWTKPYTGTNKAAFRMTTGNGASGFYLRVDDTNATYGAMLGYESMTDVDTGVDSFGSSRTWWKSSTADTTARGWVLIADGRAMMLFAGFHASSPNDYTFHSFGDAVPELPSDPYACLLIGHNSTTMPSVNTHKGDWLGRVALIASGGHLTSNGELARTGNGVTKNALAYLHEPALGIGWSGVQAKMGEPTQSSGYCFAYPSTVNGGGYAFKIPLVERTGGSAPYTVGFRGYHPGLFGPVHHRPLNHLGTYLSASPETSGRKFLAVNLGSATGDFYGQAHVDVTGPWR